MRRYQSRCGQREDSRVTIRPVLTTTSCASLMSRAGQVQGCPSSSGSRCVRKPKCWVGAERLAQSRFLDSAHRTGHARFPSDPALQGLSLLPGSHPPVRTPSISAFNARTSSGSGLVLSGMTRLWFPSPCGRFSRPPTTMEPPTLPMFLFPTAGNIRFRAASHVHDRGLCEVV